MKRFPSARLLSQITIAFISAVFCAVCLVGCGGDIVQHAEADSLSIQELPAYSGDPYVEVNGNLPDFSAGELNCPRGTEEYGELDSLGRCTVTFALVGKETMPTERRGDISEVHPTGWEQQFYSFVDQEALYNRCHLIGYQLTAENANEENLITGTRYMNVEGMEPFESMIAQYVKQTGNHVAYRVAPVFQGANMLASGVHMEALSVEDKGLGICFNVYCYNVQPGVGIDYATGENWRLGKGEQLTYYTSNKGIEGYGNGEIEIEPPEKVSNSHKGTKSSKSSSGNSGKGSQSSATADSNAGDYVLNVNSMKFHLPTCDGAMKMSEANKKTFKGSRDELIAKGYSPCGLCNP